MIAVPVRRADAKPGGYKVDPEFQASDHRARGEVGIVLRLRARMGPANWVSCVIGRAERILDNGQCWLCTCEPVA